MLSGQAVHVWRSGQPIEQYIRSDLDHNTVFHDLVDLNNAFFH